MKLESLRRLLRWAPIPLAMWLACACGSTRPSRFYVLTPVEAPSPALEPLPIAVRLHPVELPKYLATPELVEVRGNELILAKYHRWGEPLQEGFQRILSLNLALLVPTNDVYRLPWEGSKPSERRVTLSVLRFDVEGGKALLDVSWGLSSGIRDPVALTRSHYEAPVAGVDHAAFARALSDTLGQLSGEIAGAIRDAEE